MRVKKKESQRPTCNYFIACHRKTVLSNGLESKDAENWHGPIGSTKMPSEGNDLIKGSMYHGSKTVTTA